MSVNAAEIRSATVKFLGSATKRIQEYGCLLMTFSGGKPSRIKLLRIRKMICVLRSVERGKKNKKKEKKMIEPDEKA
jgi:hypothetical protein